MFKMKFRNLAGLKEKKKHLDKGAEMLASPQTLKGLKM